MARRKDVNSGKSNHVFSLFDFPSTGGGETHLLF